MNLAVIVPFYNEEKFLKKSVDRLLDNDIYFQIILADDCSSDKSSFIAKNLQKEYKKIEYVRSENNEGKGSVINLAKDLVKTTHVVIHDADLEYFPEDIVQMNKQSVENPNSLILGSRFKGIKNRNNIYIRTYTANKAMSLFFSIVNYYRITDVATCYKLMPSNFFKQINITEKGFSVEIEILSKFLKYNRSVIEVPISYEGRSYEDGKKIKFRDGYEYIVNTLVYKIKN
jgi:glycosyltransferase involved in cell wall biosynthesis